MAGRQHTKSENDATSELLKGPEAWFPDKLGDPQDCTVMLAVALERYIRECTLQTLNRSSVCEFSNATRYIFHMLPPEFFKQGCFRDSRLGVQEWL